MAFDVMASSFMDRAPFIQIGRSKIKCAHKPLPLHGDAHHRLVYQFKIGDNARGDGRLLGGSPVCLDI